MASAEGEELVHEIRDIDTDAEVLVGGQAAQLVDTKASIADRLPLAIGIIVVATFVLLFLLSGSVLVPIKALVLNLLSLTATFGAMVWIFQDGNLSGLLGFTATGAIDTSMPILMFCIAFGLSMDYEVFLLSRIKEEHDRTGDNDHAVALGLERTGRIVTAAALLLSVTFFAFGTSGVSFIKMFGIGLGIAVLIDAFVIRGTLVPAFMKLAGEANWWAPAPLRRFHARFGLREGDGAPATAPSPSARRRRRSRARRHHHVTAPRSAGGASLGPLDPSSVTRRRFGTAAPPGAGRPHHAGVGPSVGWPDGARALARRSVADVAVAPIADLGLRLHRVERRRRCGVDGAAHDDRAMGRRRRWRRSIRSRSPTSPPSALTSDSTTASGASSGRRWASGRPRSPAATCSSCSVRSRPCGGGSSASNSSASPSATKRRMSISLGALLADVPHSRPVQIIGTASDPDLIDRFDLQRSRYEGPTGIVGVLHDALSTAGPGRPPRCGRPSPATPPRCRRPRLRWRCSSGPAP